MKTYKTPPTNEDFFNEHAGSYRLYGLIGWKGQFLSFVSLAYGIYSMINDAVTTGTVSMSSYLILFIGLATAFIIEFANRALGRRAIKPFVQDKAFEGQAVDHHRILNNSYLWGLVLIGLVSYLLSGIGSVKYGEVSAAPPTLVNIDSINQLYSQQLDRIDSALITDNNTYIQPFEVRIQQSEATFQRDSLQSTKSAASYNKCAKGGKDKAYCQKKQRQFLSQIDRHRGIRADSINSINLEKAQTIAFLRSMQKGEIEEIEQKKENAVARAELVNQDLLKEQKSEGSFRSMIFLILTVLGQSLFYYMTFLQLRIEAGSGIETKIQPDEFFLQPSAIEEWAATLSWKWSKRARNIVQYTFEWEVSEPQIPFKAMKIPPKVNQQEEQLSDFDHLFESNGTPHPSAEGKGIPL
jgi:hypothetical protein